MRSLKRATLTLIALVALLLLAACAYVQQATFGKLPDGDRLELLKRSPNYLRGEFQNRVPTPMFTDDSTFVRVVLSNLFASKEGLRPTAPMPSVETDLKALDRNQNTVIWLGHSSVLRAARRQTNPDRSGFQHVRYAASEREQSI